MNKSFFLLKSELLKILKKEDIYLSKKSGQCFLIDSNIIRFILKKADLDSRKDTILEIGAGLGTLTIPLLSKCKRLFTIEYDERIIPLLKKRIEKYYTTKQYEVLHEQSENNEVINLYNNTSNLIVEIESNEISSFNFGWLFEDLICNNFFKNIIIKKRNLNNELKDSSELNKIVIINGDALKVAWPKVDFIIANIPYQISGPIIFRILEHWDYKKVILMVQKEFAERIIAKPGSKKYSRLSAAIQLFFDGEILHKVSRGCFFPEPKVDSAIIQIELKKEIKNAGTNQFRIKYKQYLLFLQGIFPYKNKQFRKALHFFYKRTPEIARNFAIINELIKRDWIISENESDLNNDIELNEEELLIKINNRKIYSQRVRDISPEKLFEIAILGKF